MLRVLTKFFLLGFVFLGIDYVTWADDYSLDNYAKPILSRLIRKKNQGLNLSGITYVPELDLFYAIENALVKNHLVENTARIYVITSKSLDKGGDVLAKNVIKLAKFSPLSTNSNPGSQNDFEDIVFLDMVDGLPRFALVNEIGEIYVGLIDPNLKGHLYPHNFNTINFNDGLDSNRVIYDNKGSEGVAFDPINRTLYIVNEGGEFTDTIRVESLQLPDGDDSTVVNLSSRVSVLNEIGNTLLQKKKSSSLPIGDMAGIFFNQGNGRVWILSDDSRAIYDISIDGHLWSTKKLPDEIELDGKKEPLEPEGIALDHEGALLIASEPNIILKFKLKN